MATYHTVKQGEHLAGIAAKYGFENYLIVWDHPENKELRERRQNPNVLFPGDRLFVPDKEAKKEPRQTGKRHRFLLTAKRLMLRVVVKEIDWRPAADTECRLVVEGAPHRLRTDGKGMIEKLIPKRAENGTLTVLGADIPVRIGHLDPVEEVSGWRERLNNLGYYAGSSADPSDPQIRSAVEEFQCDHGLGVDGKCGPATQAKIKEAHGC